MQIKTVSFKLISSCPMLMHNGALADPLNKFSKASKLITSKRQKTDADLEEMARLEFLGGLYVNDKGLPIIPSEVLEATIVNGAKAEKLGKLFKSSVFVNDHSVLDYDGSADINELWKDEKFRLVAGVKIGTARIMRTRPKFDKWSCAVQVDYLDESINEEMIIRAITKAGILVGIGDWRPKFGRFTVEKL